MRWSVFVWTMGVAVIMLTALSSVSAGIVLPDGGGGGILNGSAYVHSGVVTTIPMKRSFIRFHRPRTTFGWFPQRVWLPGATFVVVPLWMPILLLVVITCAIYLGGDARRRTRWPRCVRCGYDLTGNVSGRCPECGTATREQRRKAEGSQEPVT